MLVFNTQEANSTTDQITGAAKSANVPIVELTEQMPKEYTNLLDWMSALVDDQRRRIAAGATDDADARRAWPWAP